MTTLAEPAGPRLQPGPERRPRRRHVLPGDLDLRVPARPADLPQHRPGRLDAHRQRRDPPRAGRRRGRADRRWRVGADDPAPRRRLLPDHHHRDEPRAAWSSPPPTPPVRGATAPPSTASAGIDPDLAWDEDGNAYVTYSGLVTFGEDLGTHLGIQQVHGRPRDRQGAGGAALAVVGHRPEVPRGAAPLPARRALVPDDRRGRHRARPRHQLRPRPVDRGSVREPPEQPGARAPAAPRGRSRTPGTATWSRPRRRLRADHAGHAAARGDPGVLAARTRDVHHRRGLGRRLAPCRNRSCWRPRTGVEVEDFDFANPSSLDDPGWIAVRTLPSEVASLTSTPGRLTIVADGSTLDDSHPRFVGRRQRHIRSTVSTVVDAAAGAGGLGVPLRRAAPRLARGARQRRVHPRDRAGHRRRAPADLVGRPARPRGRAPDRGLAPGAGFNAEAMGGDRIRLVARPRHGAARTCCSPSSTAASGPPRSPRRSPAASSGSSPPRER